QRLVLLRVQRQPPPLHLQRRRRQQQQQQQQRPLRQRLHLSKSTSVCAATSSAENGERISRGAERFRTMSMFTATARGSSPRPMMVSTLTKLVAVVPGHSRIRCVKRALRPVLIKRR